MKQKFTQTQGRYLAFIDQYSRLHRRAPSEAEMRDYFGTSPPSVHQMVVTLEKRGLISRVPGKARSIQVLVPSAELPALGEGDMAAPAPAAAPQVEHAVRLAERIVSKMFEKHKEEMLDDSEFVPLVQCVADAVEDELNALELPDATSARDRVLAFAVSKYVALCAEQDPDEADAGED
ncbi:hypothetical protein WME91_53270 [Sorangium sp. So ce269]